MSAVAADTHAVLWYLTGDPRLSRRACAAMDEASAAGDPIYISAMTLVELSYLVEKRRLSAEDQRVILEAVDDPGSPVRFVPVDRLVTNALESVDRNEVADMPDRVVAATAVALRVPLVTADEKIRGSRVETIW